MRSGELSRSTDWRGSTWGGAARRARDWRVLRQSRTGRMPLWAARMTTKTTNTAAGYARTATSRSAPRRSGRVFLHTADMPGTVQPDVDLGTVWVHNFTAGERSIGSLAWAAAAGTATQYRPVWCGR